MDRQPLLIDGESVASTGGEYRTAESPASGEALAEIPVGTREDARRAVAAAHESLSTFRTWTVEERAELLRDVADAIEAERDELARWLARDQGKPLDHEARPEIDGSVAVFREAAAAVTQLDAEAPPGPRGTHQYTQLEPHGVLGVITPWNFPVGLAAEHISAGLAAGNTVVWVPAPTTSVVGLRFANVMADVLPDGVLNVVTGEGAVVGDQVVVDDQVHAIGFTGSPSTGEQIHRNATLKPAILELGGNGPVVIMDDADLDQAVNATAFSCFNNAGQVCSSSERVLVHSDVKADVVERLEAVAADYEPGDPLADDARMGPLNNPDVREKVQAHVTDACDRGATLRTGGDGDNESLYYPPTVLDDVDDDMRLVTEETFGPVAPVVEISSIDEAIERANADDYGLVASVFTNDLERAHAFAQQVRSGLVKVNEGPQEGGGLNVPYGGYTGTRSGIGRLGGKHGVLSYSQVKSVVMTHGADR